MCYSVAPGTVSTEQKSLGGQLAVRVHDEPPGDPEVTLIVFGAYSVLIGLFMMFAPGTFFDTLGAFGTRNDHYIFDNATFELPLGLLLLAAVRWP